MIRSSVLSFYHVNDSANIPFIDNALAKPGLPFASRIATAILILGYYIKLLIIPHPLMWDYSWNIIPFTGFADPWVLVSLAVYILLAFAGVKLFLRNNKSPVAFAVLFFLITIALFSNIPFLIGSALGERFLFFPSVGFCLLMALAIDKWIVKGANDFFKNKLFLIVIISLSVVYAALAVNRNGDWRDNYTLYKADVAKNPNGAKLNYFFGYEVATTLAKKEKEPAKQKQDYELAIGYFRQALAIYPDYDKAESNLAFAYFNTGQYDSSQVHSIRAIQLSPDNSFALSNLAAVYNFKKDYPDAIVYYKKAIKANPTEVSSYTYCGLCYGSMGVYDSAILYTKRAIAVDPSFMASYDVLATTYRITGKTDSAKKYEDMKKGRQNQ